MRPELKEESRALASCRALSSLLLLSTSLACRQSTSDENVYTGKVPSPAPISPEQPGGLDSGPKDPTFTKMMLLIAIADCTIERYREFETLAVSLNDKTEALVRERTPQNLAAARVAWSAAIASWEEAELFRFGPAAATREDPGGKGLREQIYSWPQVSRCKIEEQIVDQSYLKESFPSSLINARGLAAFEYLMFHTGSDNRCSAYSPINGQGTWAALGAEAITARKIDYAREVARAVLARARELIDLWEGTGNFRREMIEAGAGSETYETDHAALNAASQALFYLDRELKDQKLGRPLGLSNCFSEICVDAVESLYAKASIAHLRANLIGFRRLFQGCGEGGAGIGFDDWLRAVGAEDLSSRMEMALAGAIDSLQGLNAPLEELLVSDISKVRAIYDAVKALNDPLKSEFITVLDLELPRSVEGDND